MRRQNEHVQRVARRADTAKQAGECRALCAGKVRSSRGFAS